MHKYKTLRYLVNTYVHYSTEMMADVPKSHIRDSSLKKNHPQNSKDEKTVTSKFHEKKADCSWKKSAGGMELFISFILNEVHLNME